MKRPEHPYRWWLRNYLWVYLVAAAGFFWRDCIDRFSQDSGLWVAADLLILAFLFILIRLGLAWSDWCILLIEDDDHDDDPPNPPKSKRPKEPAKVLHVRKKDPEDFRNAG